MPKVIFRPNPTPPPFVPPTPPIDEDSVKFNPSSFSEGQTINATVFNIVAIEEHDSLCLSFTVPSIGFVDSPTFSHSDETIEQLTVSFNAPCDSNSFSEVHLAFLVDNEIISLVPLNIVD